MMETGPEAGQTPKPLMHEFFKGALDELRQEPNADQQEIIFRQLAWTLNSTIAVSNLYGEPREGGVNDMVESMRSVINDNSIAELMRERVRGIFDVAYEAACLVPHRISESAYDTINSINKAGVVKVALPNASVSASVRSDEYQRTLTQYHVLSHDGLLVYRRIGNELWFEITPRGRSTIKAHERLKASGHKTD